LYIALSAKQDKNGVKFYLLECVSSRTHIFAIFEMANKIKAIYSRKQIRPRRSRSRIRIYPFCYSPELRLWTKSGDPAGMRGKPSPLSVRKGPFHHLVSPRF